MFVSLRRIHLLAIMTVVALLFSLVLPSYFVSAKTEKVTVFISFDTPVGEAERALVRAFGGDIKYSYTIIDAVAAQVPESALVGLSRHPQITSITPDSPVEALAYATELDNSWGVKHIGAGTVHTDETLERSLGEGVKIGIIDSGINYLHPDLAPNYAGGYDFFWYDNNPMDVYGHGTHVAGTACAAMNGNGQTDPRLGVVGVAPGCELYGLRVLGDDGVGYWTDIVAAVEWATGAEVYLPAWGEVPATTTQGVKLDVVNLSLGKDPYPGIEVEQAFQNAYDTGLLIVAAAGNSGNRGGNNESMIYPALFDSVIAVGATDSTDTRASFSSTGAALELVAPGVSVYSTWNDEKGYANPQPVCTEREIPLEDINGDGELDGECYKYGSGTSMASPHVAGVAALMIAKGLADHNGDGIVDSRDARPILQQTAIDLGASGRDIQYGYGLVDAVQAMTQAGETVAVGNIAPVADAGEDQTYTLGTGEESMAVTLDGSRSSDADGEILTYVWTNSSDVVVGEGQQVQVTLSSGSYTFTLTVIDDQEAIGTDSVTITVEPADNGDTINCNPGRLKRGEC